MKEMARSKDLTEVDPKLHESWSCTSLRLVKVRHNLTIPKIRDHGEQKVFRSASISSGGDDGLEWSLELRTDSRCGLDEDYISVFLSLTSCKQPQVRIGSSFSLHDVERDIIVVSTTLQPRDFMEGDSWGSASMIERDELIAYMDQHNLENIVVSCHIVAAVAILETSSQNPTVTSSRHLDNMDSPQVCASAGVRMFLDGVHNPSSAYSTSCDENPDEEVEDFPAEVNRAPPSDSDEGPE